MNNLHRELAPVSQAAWAAIEDEARRTFTLHLAGRRIADVQQPSGPALAAVGTGHVAETGPPLAGVMAWLRQAQPVVEFRVPFTLGRQAIDDIERGARDSDWHAAQEAARTMAFAEDRAIVDGYAGAHIGGIRGSAPGWLALPADPRGYPGVVGQAIASLRTAGVGGPYSLLLSDASYGAVSETSDYGYPVRGQLASLLDGEIIWAPAIEGAVVVSARGGDYELHIGQDLSIGYESHDAEQVRLYFAESMTLLVHTPEAAVGLSAAGE